MGIKDNISVSGLSLLNGWCSFVIELLESTERKPDMGRDGGFLLYVVLAL